MQGHSCNICDSALIPKALWCPGFIIFFLAVLCIPSFYMCLMVSFSFLLSVSAWLDYLLRVVMPTPKLENWSGERIYPFFFLSLFFVCEVLTSQLPSCMNWMHKDGKQLCDIGLTLKLLNICFCFVKTLNIPSFILSTCLHAKNQEN